MAVLDLNKSNFNTTILGSSAPVLVDFWAPWCGPCQRLGPVVAQVAAEQEGKLVVGKVNIDENPDLAARYGIASIPTLILFKNGKPCPPVVGPGGKGGILQYLNENL